ncbi:MAG: glycerate kinase, partial [Verrucomicrobiales bacterium]
MNVLIAIDKFKGSLSARQAAEAITRGLPAGTQTDLCPIADGGEGFAETMKEALGGEWVEIDAA